MRDVSRKVKIRVAARHAPSIRRAIRTSVNVKTIVDNWLNAHTGITTTPSPLDGRHWAKVNVNVDSTGLSVALRKLYATGVILGQDLALNQIAKKIRIKKVTRKELVRAKTIDWANWRPGNRAAAQLISPKGSLRNLLDARNLTIQELNNTTIDRIGTILGRGLYEGATRDQMAKDLQFEIDEMLDDPARSVIIAQTEMSRAVVESNLETYRETNVEYLEYLVADPCDDCSENLAASPIPIDGSWPNGNPPVHPNCMCDVAPYIVNTENVFTD